MIAFSSEQLKVVTNIPYFRDGTYGDLSVEGTLDYMRRRYIEPIAERIDIRQAVLADCAAGFGWLSFAYLLSGGKQAIVIEPDRARIQAAMVIAETLGVIDRCRFENVTLQNLQLPDNSVDVFCSVETLEHVGRQHALQCLSVIERAASKIVVITTPNKLFPVIAHDTRLPFAHWLPRWLVRPYAKLFGRADFEHGNYFLGPWHLRNLRRKFHPTTPYQTFSTLTEFDAFYPHYLPYGGSARQRLRTSPSVGQRAFVKWVGKFLGESAYSISPNLSTIWVRLNLTD